jgi:hypothetical protein
MMGGIAVRTGLASPSPTEPIGPRPTIGLKIPRIAMKQRCGCTNSALHLQRKALGTPRSKRLTIRVQSPIT